MNENEFNEASAPSSSPVKEVNAVEKPEKVGLKVLISAVITALVGGVVYYMQLPVFNFKDISMYEFIFLMIAVFCVSFILLCKAATVIERQEYVKRKAIYPLALLGVMAVVILVGWATGATIFRAKAYSELMPVTESKFEDDFKDISYDTVPRIDQSRALTLADQQLGSLSEYKSQYMVSQNTTMINYQGHPVRVAYLEYADFFKWVNNTKNGIPAYMIIDLVTQKVSVVNTVEKFGSGIKYSPTELFNEKLIRHLRFQYPTAILDTPNFEINDEGKPYWVTPVLDKTIGLFGGEDVKGAILTDALTGESQYYSIDEVRSDKNIEWIDVVYNDRLLVEQYNFNGRLKNGFWNSMIFQNDVTQASAGCGYIAMNDDVWVYTGVTSSKADLSNFGFILCNQRTKETRYYQNGGAMEQSAQASAQDAVQNYGYKATFPILLDIEGQPTYFMSLYGASNTVKGYALVNLADKTIVGTGLLDDLKSDAKSLNAAVASYIEALKDKDLIGTSVNTDSYLVDEDEMPSSENDVKTFDVTGKVNSIKTSVNDGNTIYYLEINGQYYYISTKDCMDVLLVNVGDTVTVKTESQSKDTFVPATSIKR